MSPRRRREATNVNNLAIVASTEGDHANARAFLEESLSIRRSLSDQRGMANCLLNLGWVACEHGDYGSAHMLFEETLAIERELGDRIGIALSLSNLGDLARLQCEHSSARELLAESLGISCELGDRKGIASALGALASVAGGMGTIKLPPFCGASRNACGKSAASGSRRTNNPHTNGKWQGHAPPWGTQRPSILRGLTAALCLWNRRSRWRYEMTTNDRSSA